MLSRPIPESLAGEMRRMLDSIYRADAGRILATPIRLVGDFDLAEDAVHDAFAATLVQWQRDGVPAPSARGWFRLHDSRRLTPCGAVPGSTHRRKTWPNNSLLNRVRLRT